MKNSRVFQCMLFAVCFWYSLQPPSYSQGNNVFVAVPYPGSISEPPQKGLEWRSQTFYSKDPVGKVRTHYTRSLGVFDQSTDDTTAFSRSVIPYRDLLDFLTKRGVVLGEVMEFPGGIFAGVALYGRRRNYNNTVNTVMDKLKSAYLMRFINPDVEDLATVTNHLEDAELKKTLARYEHVLWEHFPLSKDKPMNEIVYEKCIVAPEQETAKEQQELAKKMSELTTQMKYDEAGKVGDRMMQLSARATDAKWNWDIAIKCMQELEKNSYATMIVIDKHPSQWNLSDQSKK